MGDVETPSRPVHRRVIEATGLVVGGKLHFTYLLENHGFALLV